MTKTIVDTDMGIDDAHALAMALGSPEIEIVGFSTVSGNTTADRAARNVSHLLDICNRSEISVRVGALVPSTGERPFGGEMVHGAGGLGDCVLPDEALSRVHDNDAISWMIDTVVADPGGVQILALGPLTNLAIACQERGFVEGVRRIVFMGGIVSGGPGNVLPLSTANIANDADAAKTVFHAGCPLVMVGQDVTRMARMTSQRKRALADVDTSASRFLLKISAFYERAYAENEPQWPGFPLHDMVAMAYLVAPEIFRTEHLYVTAETRGEVTLGQTVADRRRRPMGPPNMDVCAELDYERLFDLYIERVHQL